MKKAVYLLMAMCLICALICSCGSETAQPEKEDSSQKEESSSETVEIGLFSGVGGWKTDEGIIAILDSDGTGVLLSEVSYGGDTSNLNLPSVFKTEYRDWHFSCMERAMMFFRAFSGAFGDL